MKKILLLFAISILAACSNNDEAKDPEPSDAENYHSFFENSKLILSPAEMSQGLDLEVATGDKLVFKFLKYEDPEEIIADDEQTTIVYFEVGAGATEFKLQKKKILTMQMQLLAWEQVFV